MTRRLVFKRPSDASTRILDCIRPRNPRCNTRSPRCAARQARSPEDPDCHECVGQFVLVPGRYAEAEPLYVQVVQGRTRALGAEHRDTIKAGYDLAGLTLYETSGQSAKAAVWQAKLPNAK
jgi:hypothetical protein